MLARNEAFFGSVLPQYRFTALYTGDFSAEEVSASLASGQYDFLSRVTLMLCDYAQGQRLFSFPGGDALCVMATQDGYRHEGIDDLLMISLETALGLSTQQASMSRAFFPQSSADEWSVLSRTWSAGKTYYGDFGSFDFTSIYGMETRVRSFLAMDFSYESTGNHMNIMIDNFSGEAWFILRVHNAKVSQITGGSATRLSDTAYLIAASSASVAVELAQTHIAPLP